MVGLNGNLFYDPYGLSASITVSRSGFGGDTTQFTTAYLLKAEVE